MELVNMMEKNVLIAAYTVSFDRIDPAVLSRIHFQVAFSNQQELEDYIIIVRRYLLELWKVENLIDLEGRTFEQTLWALASFFYRNNYDMELIMKIFTSFKQKKIQYRYGNTIKMDNIMDVAKYGIEGGVK